MENHQPTAEGICILSLDCGGSGSISQLRMINEFMERLASDLDVEEDEIRPAGYFDLIGGVGVGGFVALLLGRLGMTANQAMDELSTIGNTVFTKDYKQNSPETNTKRLREAIETMLQRCGHTIDINLRTDSARCKVVVFAAAPAVVDLCQPLRTYRARRGNLGCTFVEAACAIMAVPEFFSSVGIGPTRREQHFAGIPYGCYNPTRAVFREAREIFGDKTPVSLVLSLGSGQGAILTDVDRHATRMSHVHCDTASKDLSYQLSGVAAYLRLNVDRRIENIDVDDWHNLGVIVTHTTVYLEMSKIIQDIDEACRWLLDRNGSVNLGQLTGTITDGTVRFDSQKLGDYLERGIKEMHNIVQELGIEKITLVDAIGNDVPIPKHFCPTYAMLLDVIGVYFRHQKPPGTDFVERGDYRLVHGSRRSILDSVEWDQLEKVKLKLEMSMVLRRRNDDKARCPRCRTRSDATPTNGWVICSSCSGQFQIEDHVEEEVESRPSQYDDEYAIRGNIVTPGVISTGEASQSSSQGNLPLTGIKKRTKQGQEQFRLISVINLLDNPANATCGLEANARLYNSIVEGAFNSLQAIAPASTNHLQRQQVIQKIRDHHLVYLEAINTSINGAQDGYGFSSDVIELCDYLLHPDTDQVVLQEYIKYMQSKAKLVGEGSLMTMNKVRDVYEGLIEIAKTTLEKALASPEGGEEFVIRVPQPSVISEIGDPSIETAVKELNVAAMDYATFSEIVNNLAQWWNGDVIRASREKYRGIEAWEQWE